MKAGDLNRRITIQARVDGEDAAGQPLLSWVNYDKTWADIRGYTGLGRIRVTGAVSADAQNVSIRVRYRTDLTFALRVCLNDDNDDPIEDDPFDITHVELDRKGRVWTDMVSVGGTNDG